MKDEIEQLEKLAEDLKIAFQVKYIDGELRPFIDKKNIITFIDGDFRIVNQEQKTDIKMGKTYEEAKHWMIKSYVWNKYWGIKVPKKIYDKLYEAEYLFWQWNGLFRDIARYIYKKTCHDNLDKFIKEFQGIIEADGNTNFEGILDRYYCDEKEQKDLERYKDNPEKFLKTEKVKAEKKEVREKIKAQKQLEKQLKKQEQRVKRISVKELSEKKCKESQKSQISF